MKFNALSLLFFLLPLLTHGQATEVSCKVIFRDNKILFGLIKNREWLIAPDKIKFKADSESHFREYGPEQIKSFQLNDELYIGTMVEVNDESLDVEDLKEDTSFHIQKQYHFIKRIAEGPKSLYALQLRYHVYNFYVETDSVFTLLLCKRFIGTSELKNERFYNENGYNFYERSTYRNQLKDFLADCYSIDQQIEKTNYELNSLMKLWGYYEKCTNAKQIDHRNVNHVHVEFFTGVSASTIRFSGNDKDLYFGTRFQPFLCYSIGAELNRNVFGRIGRHKMALQCSARKFSANGLDEKTNYNVFTNYPFKINWQTTSIRATLLHRYYVYSKNKVQFHTALGAFMGYHLINHNKATQLNGNGMDTGFLLTSEKGVAVGTGIQKKRWHMNLLVDYSLVKNNIIHALGAHFQSISLSLGYSF